MKALEENFIRDAQLLGDRLLVRRDDPTGISAGGIHLAHSAQRAAMRGTVIALGTGRNRKTGKVTPYDVAIGDRVLFSPNLGEEWQGGPAGRGEIEWPGEGLALVLREADIIGVEESPGEGAAGAEEPDTQAHLLSGRRAGRLRGDVGKIMHGAELEA